MTTTTTPATREIRAHELSPGMTVIDGTDGPLVVTSVNRSAADTVLVSFEGVPEPTLYGRLVTVDILAEQVARPGIAAAMTAARALLAAGWRYDSTSPMADYTTIRTLLHPSGREIHARTVDGGEQTALTMTGLTLDQVAGAINGAGLAPAEPTSPIGDVGKCPQCGKQSRSYSRGCPGCGFGVPTEKPDYWLTLADDLRQAADRVATLAGTTPPVRVKLDITGAYPGNTDRTAAALTDAVAAAFGVTAYSHAFPAGDSVYKADRSFNQLHLQVVTYLPAEQSELERLRAENARLQAQLAEGGATR